MRISRVTGRCDIAAQVIPGIVRRMVVLRPGCGGASSGGCWRCVLWGAVHFVVHFAVHFGVHFAVHFAIHFVVHFAIHFGFTSGALRGSLRGAFRGALRGARSMESLGSRCGSPGDTWGSSP